MAVHGTLGSGNYGSEPFELTVYHHAPMNIHEKAKGTQYIAVEIGRAHV